MVLNNRHILTFSIAVLSLALAFAQPIECTEIDGLKRPELPDPTHTRVLGQADYNWTITGLSGTEVDFSEFKNKVVFLHFWATWCPYCIEEMSSIQRLYESLKDNDDIKFVMATYQDQDIVRKYISKKQLNLPIYFHDRAVSLVLGPSKTYPRTLIINPKGQIVYKHIGAAKWDDKSVNLFLKSLR
jgi:thiol-disulfide isomerase/thioredoxin